MELPVPIDAEVSWDSPKQCFTGQVRYCAYREIGYFVGVEFAPGLRWSEEAFQPQHLLDVRHLQLETRQPAKLNRTPPTSAGLTIQ
jgi:hypothetical protein